MCPIFAFQVTLVICQLSNIKKHLNHIKMGDFDPRMTVKISIFQIFII